MNGFKFSLSNINSYFASYFFFEGEEINTRDTYFLMPTIELLISLLLYPGALLGKKIGIKKVILIGLIFHFATFITLIFFSDNFYLVLLSFGFLGIGLGLSNLNYLRNSWKYFPYNQGLVYGVIISSSGIMSTLLTILADFFIINPNREKTINGMYPKHVANNVKKYINIIVIIFICMDLIGFFLTFDYDKIPETEEEKFKKLNEQKKKYINNIDINSTNNNKSIYNSEILKDIGKGKINIKSAFFSIINLELLIFCFCGLFLDFFITNSYRDFGNRNNITQTYLYIIGILFNLLNGFTRFIWGFLLDQLGFKKLMLSITFIEIIIGSSVYYIVEYKDIFVVELLLTSICIGGSLVIIPPLFNNLFTLYIGPELFGITGISIGISNLLGPIIIKFFSGDNISFLIVFLIGTSLCIFKLIVLLFFEENKKVFEINENIVQMKIIDIPSINNDE